MSRDTMKDETFILLRSPGEEQRKILDQYRLTEIYRDVYGNYMLDHCPEGKAVRNAIAAVKQFKEVDEVDIGQWKDLMIDLIYSYRVLGFRHWEYFSYGLEDRSIAERLEFLASQTMKEYYIPLYTGREGFLQLSNKYLTYQKLAPYYKRDMYLLQGNEQKGAFFEFCRRHPRFIIKPVNGMVGKRVELIDREDYKNPEELFEALRAKGKPSSPILCEELIVCEDSMRALHPQSVNSVRIFTYLKTNGEPAVVCAWLKAGQGDAAVDNGGAGGVVAAINVETGAVYTDAADESRHMFPVHPDTGFVFKGFQIPRWEELKRIVLELAPAFPGVPLIGWDVALSKDRGWQLIEGNGNGAIHLIQIATKTGFRREFEAAIEWDKRRVKLREAT